MRVIIFILFLFIKSYKKIYIYTYIIAYTVAVFARGKDVCDLMMLLKEGGIIGREKRFDETLWYLERGFFLTEPAITFPIEFPCPLRFN